MLIPTPTHIKTDNLFYAFTGIEEVPVKSVVNRVGHQLQKALSEKGMALLVNHGIADEKVSSASRPHIIYAVNNTF